MLKKASPLGLFVCLFIDVVYTRGQWSLSFRTSSALWRWLQGQGGSSGPALISPQLKVVMSLLQGHVWHRNNWYPHVHLLVCTVAQRGSQFDPKNFKAQKSGLSAYSHDLGRAIRDDVK